jgi:predicted DNA-binding transcriptional regulator AlpA
MLSEARATRRAVLALGKQVEALTVVVEALRAAQPAQKLATVNELVELGYGSRPTIRRRIADGSFPVVRVGRLVKVDLAALATLQAADAGKSAA